MQHADEALLSVVVLELGSSWPPWLAEYQKHAPNSVVVAQSAGESSAHFAQRIARKTEELRAHDAIIHAGLLVSNGALDAESVAARKLICSYLLRLMIQKQRGELVLAADVTTGDDVRHELFALAGTLCDDLRGSPVSVRVRFDTVRPPNAVSGVMKTVGSSSGVEDDSKTNERASNVSR
jgi:hypothetical protein